MRFSSFVLSAEKLDKAIAVIESLNGSRTPQKVNQPTVITSAPVNRTMSASARRKIAAAQRARWAKVRKESQAAAGTAKTTGSAPAKRTMSAARKKITALKERDGRSCGPGRRRRRSACCTLLSIHSHLAA